MIALPSIQIYAASPSLPFYTFLLLHTTRRRSFSHQAFNNTLTCINNLSKHPSRCVSLSLPSWLVSTKHLSQGLPPPGLRRHDRACASSAHPLLWTCCMLTLIRSRHRLHGTRPQRRRRQERRCRQRRPVHHRRLRLGCGLLFRMLRRHWHHKRRYLLR